MLAVVADRSGVSSCAKSDVGQQPANQESRERQALSEPQIVFVETQGRLLKKVGADLKNSQADWRVTCFADEQAALDEIERKGLTFVLANLGPDHEGCERFLRTVRDRAPMAIRMALVPDLRDGKCVPALEYAHQCLAEQMGAEQIEEAVGRGLAMWSRVAANENLAGFLSDLHTLPTPPALYFDIRDELASPNGSMHRVAEHIARDPALTAKILKVVNSGLYGLPRSVSDLHHAIVLLGAETLMALVLAARLFAQLPLPGLKLDSLWVHCTMVAALAKEIAAEEGGDQKAMSASAVAGLLHDIGGLVFLANAPQRYFPLVRQAVGDESVLLEKEHALFGLGHPELGAYLLELWGLPDGIVEAVSVHHDLRWDALDDVALPCKAVFGAEWLIQKAAHLGEAEPTDSVVKPHPEVPEDMLGGWLRAFERVAKRGLVTKC